MRTPPRLYLIRLKPFNLTPDRSSVAGITCERRTRLLVLKAHTPRPNDRAHDAGEVEESSVAALAATSFDRDVEIVEKPPSRKAGRARANYLSIRFLFEHLNKH
jgi:hypothetical protein